jgi:hypothetical protein
MNKTDVEILENVLKTLVSITNRNYDRELSSVLDMLDVLAEDIYDHLSSKTIQTDYVMPRIL